MRATLVLFDSHQRAVTARRSRLRERVSARFFPWQLDAALARGVPADSRGDLSLRAHRLISPRTRRRLVAEMSAIVDEATHPTPARHRVVRGCDVEVLVTAPLLQEIAQRLSHPGPVEAAGVAQIGILLHDGTGPLYSEAWTGELERVLLRALDALTPRFDAAVNA
jgi:hypothetical protein